MPCLSLPDALLDPLHLDHFRATYPGTPGNELVNMVCNVGCTLPEKTIGNVWHMPCCWLGDSGDSLYHPTSAEGRREARRRLGWKALPYLVVLPAPSKHDIQQQVALSPATEAGHFLREELERAGIDLRDVMVSYVSRFTLPRTMKNYSAAHTKSCLHYLKADILNIQPRVIIACGAKVVKALYGRNAKLDTYRGDIIRYEDGGFSCPIVPTVSHLAFIGDHANLSVFRSELRKARELVSGEYSLRRHKPRYQVVHSLDGVKKLCERIRRDAPKRIAFDTEYGNDVAREEETYTISVQMAWGNGRAACVLFREHRPQSPYWQVYFTGVPRKDGTRRAKSRRVEPEPRYGVRTMSEEDEQACWGLLQDLFLDKRWRIDAHNLRVDVEQFARNGHPIDERIEDGFCTMLVHHLLYGDEEQNLEHLVRKYVPYFGAYWRELDEWLGANSGNSRLQYGYRDIPLDILVPYSLKDADATWEIVERLEEELDAHPRLKKLYWGHVAPTSLHLLDVERHGILIDEQRRMELYDAYKPVYDDILAKFREAVNWPSFNPNSPDQKKAILFDTTVYRDKKDVPAGVKTFGLTPVFNTDKYPKDWAEIESANEELYNAPSTKAAALELLSHENPDIVELKWLKHLSVIGKFLSTYLAPQELNEYGYVSDGKGFHNNIHKDGRVRTHLSQLTETGRYTSSKANLQTKPKKQEAAAFEALVEHKFGISVGEYKERCADDYEGDDRIAPEDQIHVPKFASCFIAPPGYCLIEADFKTAELCIWAYCSGDPELIKVVNSGRDLHSEMTALSFQLPELADLEPVLHQLDKGDRKPYDDWAENIKAKYPALRVAAKSVNFGIMYGRGALALTREINKVVSDPVSVEDTQKIITNLSTRFNVAWEWLVDNSESAVENEFIENIFGRRRYFQGASVLPEMDQAAIKREAKNSPIQGAVADLLAQAGFQLYRLLKLLRGKGKPVDIKTLLPIHDAFLFEVKNEDVAKAVKIINLCMSDSNLLPGTQNKLMIDLEIMPHRWSDKPSHTAEEFYNRIAA